MEIPWFAIIVFKVVQKLFSSHDIDFVNDVFYLSFEPMNGIHMSVAVIMWISQRIVRVFRCTSDVFV